MDPRRSIRADLGAIDDRTARAFLEVCATAIAAEVRRFVPSVRVLQGVDEDDLVALARAAALEAYATWTPSRACTRRTWAARVMRWRLGEAVGRALERRDEYLEKPEAVLNGANPSEVYDGLERVSWLQGAVAKLPKRHQILVAAKLRGESTSATGRSIGIGKTQASRQLHEAIALLAEAAHEVGLDGSEHDQ